MGDVIDLSARRERHAAAVDAAAERAACSPGLGWAVIDEPRVAHRRQPVPLPGEVRGLTSRAACGAGDDLVLARAQATPCPECFPDAGQ